MKNKIIIAERYDDPLEGSTEVQSGGRTSKIRCLIALSERVQKRKLPKLLKKLSECLYEPFLRKTNFMEDNIFT